MLNHRHHHAGKLEFRIRNSDKLAGSKVVDIVGQDKIANPPILKTPRGRKTSFIYVGTYIPFGAQSVNYSTSIFLSEGEIWTHLLIFDIFFWNQGSTDQSVLVTRGPKIPALNDIFSIYTLMIT